MSANKNASIRYHILDKCLSNPVRKYFIEDLVKACDEALKEINPSASGIKKRTIQYDLRHMESAEGWNAPIQHLQDGKRIYYRYSDKQFSIDNQPLNQAEIEQLKSALEILGRFQGMPQFEWVNELTPKLEQAFIIEKGTAPIISFDNNNYLRGIKRLGELFHHILYKRPLCITYQSFKSEQPRQFIIHPYYLKQYNNRWFLFGLNHDLQKISNHPLDRIIDVKEKSIKYIANTAYDFNEYFEDVIGVTLSSEAVPEKVILRFDPQAAPYVISKPLHGSQKSITHDDQELMISIEVIPNYELESLILSFGDLVTVLQPDTLRDKILNRCHIAIQKYKS
jgi:predicted DNA-binding transcriptional regulator YafY